MPTSIFTRLPILDPSQKLKEDDFENRSGMFLGREKSYKMIKAINELFDKRIKHQRIKRFGEYSKIRTAIREEPSWHSILRGERNIKLSR